MTQLVHDTTDLRVLTEGHIVFFKADEPRNVPDALRQACLDAGAFPVGGPKPAEPVVETDEVVDQLVTAVEAIFAENDPHLIKQDGEPRAAAIKKYVPKYTAEQLAEAMQVVDAKELIAGTETE